MPLKKIINQSYEDPMTYVLGKNREEDSTNPTNHDFEVRRTSDDALLGKISFHAGPLEAIGPNGILNENLLVMLIDRVESFQRSKLKCRENENALQHLYEALWWLNFRNNKKK